MTQTHDDRVAERPHHLCAAYGCPLLGSMSESTQGTNGEWWCFAHFKKDVGQYQGITAELRRLDWLTKAITDVRTRERNPDYGAAFQRLEHDFMLAQRKDLLWTQPETDEQWMVRLERELGKLLSGHAAPAPVQHPLIPAQDTGSFNRVAITMPAKTISRASA